MSHPLFSLGSFHPHNRYSFFSSTKKSAFNSASQAFDRKSVIHSFLLSFLRNESLWDGRSTSERSAPCGPLLSILCSPLSFFPFSVLFSLLSSLKWYNHPMPDLFDHAMNERMKSDAPLAAIQWCQMTCYRIAKASLSRPPSAGVSVLSNDLPPSAAGTSRSP